MARFSRIMWLRAVGDRWKLIRRNCRKQIHGSLLKLTRDGDQSVWSSIGSPLTQGRKHYGEMVWVDVSSRVLCAASEQVLLKLGSNTICDFTVQTLPKMPYSHRCDETHKRWRYFLQSFHGSAAEGWTSNALRIFYAAIEKYNVQ